MTSFCPEQAFLLLFKKTVRNWWSSCRKLERKRKGSERTYANSRTSSLDRTAGKDQRHQTNRLIIYIFFFIYIPLHRNSLNIPQKRAEGRSLALGGGIQRVQAHQGQAEAPGSPDQQKRLFEIHLASGVKRGKAQGQGQGQAETRLSKAK